uniref:Uncharacterized protein n=1 Tax=Arundo donax TaxID=35708 RepID=A0A0A8Y2L5_ARUDO
MEVVSFTVIIMHQCCLSGGIKLAGRELPFGVSGGLYLVGKLSLDWAMYQISAEGSRCTGGR